MSAKWGCWEEKKRIHSIFFSVFMMYIYKGVDTDTGEMQGWRRQMGDGRTCYSHFSHALVAVHSCFISPFPHVLLLMNAHTHNANDFSSAICKAVILLYPSAPSGPFSFPVLDLMTELNSAVRQSTLNYHTLHTPVQQWNWPSHILQLLPLDIAKCNYGRKYMGPSYGLTLTGCCINFIVSLQGDRSQAY